MTVGRMVVAYDGGDGSIAAARWAARHAPALGSDVIAVNVAGELTHDPEFREAAARIHDPATRREHWVRQVGSEPDDFVVTEGRPGLQILATAETASADLVVVGTEKRERWHVGWLGSTATWIAHHTEVPTVIVPADVDVGQAGRILVGVDGSEAAFAAASWAAEVASRTEAGLYVLHSAIAPVTFVPEKRSHDEWLDDVRTDVESWVAPLRTGGLSLVVEVDSTRQVARTLLDAADRVDADLVVVGARGLGGFTGLRLGGTAMKVMHHAERPLAIVPLR